MDGRDRLATGLTWLDDSQATLSALRENGAGDDDDGVQAMISQVAFWQGAIKLAKQRIQDNRDILEARLS